MKLSFEMLVYQLSKMLDMEIPYTDSKLSSLNPPLIYSLEESIKKNQIYLVTDKNISSNHYFDSCCLIFIGIEQSISYNNIDSKAIYLGNEISIAKVWNTIQSIFFLYQDWIEQLQHIVHQKGTLQELLDFSSAFLECQLYITDEYLHLLAASNRGEVVTSEPFIENESFKTLIDAAQNMNPTFQRFDFKKLNSSDEATEIYIYNIFDSQINLGALSMHPCKSTLQKHDFQLFKILAPFVKKVFLRHSQINGNQITNVLETLLSNTSNTKINLSKIHKALNYDIDDQLRCIVIQFSEEIITKYGFYLKQRFQIENPSSVALLHEENLIGILNNSKTLWNSKNFQQSIQNWIGNIQFIAGASNCFMNLFDLSSYYIEAKAAISFTDKEASTISVFSDCWIPYILQNCIGDLPIQNLLPTELLNVIRYNQTSNVDYIETLKIWIEEGRNDTRTASRLFISRNSFLSRRERLFSLLDNTLDNPDIRFQLYLSIRLYEQQNKKI